MAKKPSAWATQVDDEEASGESGLAPLPAAFANQADTAFPSLGDAVKVVETKADRKKKASKMSLADFNSLGSGGGGAASGKFSVSGARARTQQKDFDEVLRNLPRAPRGDREGEDSSGPSLGGGFREYGGNRGGFGDREERSERRGFGDRDRRGGFGDRDDASQTSDDGPSRADMADDWGASRKFTPSTADERGDQRGFGSGGFADREREPRRGFGDGGFADRSPMEDAGPSRADMADNWGANRAALPDLPRGSAFGERRSGGGFADRDGFRDRRDSDLFSGSSRADEAGSWGRRTPETSSAPPAAAGERPRLKLQPRTLPPPVIKKEEEAAAAGEEQGGGGGEEVAALPARPKPRSNPFGAARPREEVLADKTKSDTSVAGSSAGSEQGAAGTGDADKPADTPGETAEQAVQEAEATLAQTTIDA